MGIKNTWCTRFHSKEDQTICCFVCEFFNLLRCFYRCLPSNLLLSPSEISYSLTQEFYFLYQTFMYVLGICVSPLS